MANRLITFTTDFGLSDHFVGVMKGVVAGIAPVARVIDISHDVAPYNVTEAAFIIAEAWPYFPKRTIHVVVVDPGVGSARRPILAEAGGHFFIAPDNGVLSMVFEREDDIIVRHANVEHYYLSPMSKTFHGRDVFAPVAAWLTKGWQTASMGEEISDYKKFSMPRPKEADGGLKGVVLRVDAFGNLITNFRAEHLPAAAQENGNFLLQVGAYEVKKLVDTFAQGVVGEPIAYIGSSGFIEIGVNKGSAARTLSLGRGTPVVLPKK